MAHGVVLTGRDLDIKDVHGVAVEGAKTSLSESCRPAVEVSWRVVEEMVLEDKPVYGVNTGVGPSATGSSHVLKRRPCSAIWCERCRPAWAGSPGSSSASDHVSSSQLLYAGTVGDSLGHHSGSSRSVESSNPSQDSRNRLGRGQAGIWLTSGTWPWGSWVKGRLSTGGDLSTAGKP